MAEAFVSLIVGRIGDLLIQQASFLVGVKDQVEDLRNELMWIQSFLEDADSRQDEGSVVQTWVSQIRDVAYDIEDIIDTYILKVVDEDENPTARRRGILGSLKKYACICKKGANLYTIGNEVEEVKTRIRRIGEAMQKYGIHRKDGGGRGGDMRRPSPQQRFLRLRRSSPHDDGTLKDTVELGKKVEGLVAKLENEEVITITGMGGIGKTTLATKVYNCEKVKRHFERRAWAYVSKDFNVKDVFKRLVKEVTPNLSTEELQKLELLSEEDLEEKLRELLKDYTYLVVLDDIWDLEAWESLKRALPHNKSGRVILTSRNTRIAKESFIYQLRPLNEIDSWKLFVVKAFGNDDCPTNLEASGKEMVNKCDGLPLAITVLAGLLRGKSPQEWFIVGDHIDDQLMKAEGKNNVEKILSLSYNDLPHQLKPCFLYIGLFPEDFEIYDKQLIWFWVAEGFIRCERDYKTMEDVAEDYLNELIDRNMLQLVGQDEFWKVRLCRIHDLLRDICISKGQKEHFIDYSLHATSSSSSSSSSTMVTAHTSRRYAIQSGIGRYDFFNLSSNSHLRTLLLFNPDRESLQQRQLEFISKMRLLRVLNLIEVDLEGMRLPDAFGKLIHLRYLGLKNAKLPSSIGSLRSLLTLRLWGNGCCNWNDIPIGALSKLTQLRQLEFNEDYWNGLDRVAAFNLRFETLTNLQSLYDVDALIWEKNEMTNLINLQDLRIINMQTSSDVELVLSSVAKLDKIQSLCLQLTSYPSEVCAFSTPLLLSHCRHLHDLTLVGKIERLPEDPFKELPSRLTKLQLKYSRLGPEAMAILAKLPHLMFLYLSFKSIMGKKIVCSAPGFPQLRYFHVVCLDTEEWEIKEGALPKLSHLKIYMCNNLKKIPMGLRFVASIQVLKFWSMSKEFWDRFDRGEDAHEIGHIPSIETFR